MLLDEEATRLARRTERRARGRRGRPYHEFMAEWEKRRPPEAILTYYGEWPLGGRNRDVVPRMRGRERLHAALHGGDRLAFAPRLWAALPSFVHLARPAEFWHDVGSTQRMLSDAARVCSAEAVTIPVPPRPLSAERLRSLPERIRRRRV